MDGENLSGSSLQSEQQKTGVSDSNINIKPRLFLMSRKLVFMVVGLVLVVVVGLGIVIPYKYLWGGNAQLTQTVPGVSGEERITAEGKAVFWRGADLYSVDLTGRSVREIVNVDSLNPGKESRLESMKLSTDGQLVGFIVQDESQDGSYLQVVNIADGSILDVFQTQAGDMIYDFAWIPDSAEVIVSYAETLPEGALDIQKYFLGRMSVLGFPGTKHLVDWVRPVMSLTVSPSGYIYFLDGESEIRRFPLDGGSFLSVLKGVNTFDLSADGKKIAYERKSDGEIWVVREDGVNPFQVTFTSDERKEIYGIGGRSNPKWSPDNVRILFTETGANYVGIGLVNNDGSGLKSIETNPISPRIVYNEYFTRQLENSQWVARDVVLFVGSVTPVSDVLTSDLFILSLEKGVFQEVVHDVESPIWSKL